MDHWLKLKDLTCEGRKFHHWPFIEILDDNDLKEIRIYYALRPEQNGFDFISVQQIAYTDEQWPFHEESWVEVIYSGVAFFDGVRHMWMGSEENDELCYVNYPSLKEHIRILEELRKLEIKYCRDVKE